MPFNRDTFDEAVTTVFAQACRNVEKDGRAHTVIHAFDRRGHVAAMILETYGDIDPATEQDMRARGVTPFRGPFRDHLPELSDLFQRTNAVAAIHISEAWKAAYDPNDDRPPSQREQRDEVVITQGAWPAQVYERALIAQIVRDASGKPTTRPYPDEMSEHFTVGWLAECLPDIQGRYAPPA